MKKKIYMAPAIDVTEVDLDDELLAGSGADTDLGDDVKPEKKGDNENLEF